MSKSYSELLKDPRWQRKRLEILERANWECENCGDSESTLNVHHGYYEKGLKPWEYDSETLYCLCEDCHREYQHKLNNIHKQIGLAGHCLERINGYISALQSERYDDCEIEFTSHEEAIGIADYFSTDVGIVFHVSRTTPNGPDTLSVCDLLQFLNFKG